MNIVLNGDSKPLPGACSVRSLLASLDLADKPCAVEVNEELVPKREHETHELRDGDRVEVVTLVGGG